MVGKVSERVLLREGLERTDNGMKLTSWPDVTPINQKNYYTDYMKRDDQILALRLQSDATRDRLVQSARDRDRLLSKPASGDMSLPLPTDIAEEDGATTPSGAIDPSRIIVIHPGSQNLRIGFASDALPKTIPMVIGTKYPQSESDMYEPLPRRQMEAKTTDQQYGDEWTKRYLRMCGELKTEMRANKRKVLPNSKELVQTFNRRTEPEIIEKHNDPLEIDWTDIKKLDDPEYPASCFIGNDALRVPDDSDPKFKLWWPIRHGLWNEDKYSSQEHLYDDFESLLDRALRQDLGLKTNSEWQQYSCVFVIPDLYDKHYVEQMLRSAMTWFEFSRICFVQESMAATFGAGYTQACVVDVGAQKTSVSCVEDGLCVDDSRINLKYGGYDITETFIKMMLYDNFPYQGINLQRRYDFLLAEELKMKHCTMSHADVSVQLYHFHVRAPNEPTKKHAFKTYDEVILSGMGVFEPSIFDNDSKLRGRRKLVERSYNAYDVDIPDDPSSAAQLAILALVKPSLTSTTNGGPQAAAVPDVSTPSKEKSQPFNFVGRVEAGLSGTPAVSHAGSPAPEGSGTPVPAPYVFGSGGGKDGLGCDSPAPSGSRAAGTPVPGQASQASQAPAVDGVTERSPASMAAEREAVLPMAPLDIAILTSIQNAARGDDKKLRDFLGSIMVIGGGSKIPHFTVVLEEKLKARRPDLADKILVTRSARDMDEQVVAWKGASVFSKLPTNDSWITPFEFEKLGSRTLHHKVLWACLAIPALLGAVTYLLGVSLFSISFLVFLNSSVSFVITDLVGQKDNVGDVVGTLGFADELVALVACPVWGLVSDRLGVRWVATIGYAVIGIALAVFVQARNVYPQLLLARLFFAVGASASATMVTAILPSLTDEVDTATVASGPPSRVIKPNVRLSAAFSVESEATITPERYTRTLSQERSRSPTWEVAAKPGKPSALAGFVGSFTGCGALVSLALFLPLPARFGRLDGVTPGEAVAYSFYVVGAVSLAVALFVSIGLRNLRGEEGKGWRALFGIRRRHDALDELDSEALFGIRRRHDALDELDSEGVHARTKREVVPYLRLMKDSVWLGLTDSKIAIGYMGGFVARASTVAISLFIPLLVNTYFIDNGFCRGSPNDPSPELKKECRAAYVLSSILTGVAQLMGLVCAPLFGYLSGRTGRVNYPVVAASSLGIMGYMVLPHLSSPEVTNVDGRGGSPVILVIVALIGVSQIGAIVCSLGSLGQGVLEADVPRSTVGEEPSRSMTADEDEGDEAAESDPLVSAAAESEPSSWSSRVRLKGSIAGVYSLCGGAAILILTKVGGVLFDRLSHGAPFYMMAAFNGAWLVASLLLDASQAYAAS
ncbi:hypothetical protein L249_6640 [Ophiocordyceps polyrhachis-furcata BCC 54312]|uniref:Actin-related protein 8 n=1 Tax=Ophiocordyceps polyrhachis-furcata BCC 54312 TaxID=1330021 RepID=A0A367LJI1_9HYPO|nr:hypothetical protein L249_6640 [Ophiocordyceps polyrhachis-furcata BCC 54312]